MRVTLNDIAKIANTSSSTVSRVLNNRNNVNKKTREAVEKALKEAGYYKNTAASSLTNSNVLILVESLKNNVYVSHISGIYNVLVANGIQPYVYVYRRGSDNEINQLMQVSKKSDFCGVIHLSAIDSPELANLLNDFNIPFIAVNRYLRTVDVDRVIMDNYKIGYMATQFLIENGHTSIAHLAGPQNSTASIDRLRGYKDALQDNNLPIPDEIFAGDLSYESGYEAAENILQHLDKYSAIFCANDTMAIGLIEKFYEHNILCPENFSLICADNTRDIAISKARITTIGYDSETIGEAAANLLLERIQNAGTVKKTITYTPEITIRNSVKKINH